MSALKNENKSNYLRNVRNSSGTDKQLIKEGL